MTELTSLLLKRHCNGVKEKREAPFRENGTRLAPLPTCQFWTILSGVENFPNTNTYIGAFFV